MAAAKNSSISLVLLLLLVETLVSGSPHEQQQLQHRRLLLRSSKSSSDRSRSITISGTVFCDACLESRLTESSFVFKDAKILVQCGDFATVVHTNDKGQYTMQVEHDSFKAPCKTTLLSSSSSSSSSSSLTSCNIASSTALHFQQSSAPSPSSQAHHKQQEQQQLHVQDLVYRPRDFAFCPRGEALSLGPPDPPQPSSKLHKAPPARSTSMSTSESSKKVESYHLGPPDPPRPTTAAASSGHPRHG